MAQAKRLETDPEYKERHKKLQLMPASIGPFRERLPPSPFGARGEADKNFRAACFKENGLQLLMRAMPEMAAEILLALIIEVQPERGYRSGHIDVDLGLNYPEDAYTTALWESPFSAFLRVAPDVALDALIALVNFSTERWFAEAMKAREGPPAGVTLQFEDGSEKAFPSWWQVFGWPQTSSARNGNLFCALVSVLLNVAKYRPSLLTGALALLLTFPYLFYWDSVRVEQVADNFVGLNWVQRGEAIFDFAHDWPLAPHRQQRFLDVVVELLLANDVVRRLKALVST